MVHLIKLKNISGTVKTWEGKEFSIGEEYTVPTDANRSKWVNSTDVLTAITNSNLQVGDGSEYITDVSNQIDWLKGNIAQSTTTAPFAEKVIDGKNIFQRVHGVTKSCIIGDNTIEFDIPYPLVKFNELEIFGGEHGDTVDLEVYYLTTKLNQFGYAVNVSNDYYHRASNYDADLTNVLTIKVTYNSISVKSIGINFILHELK